MGQECSHGSAGSSGCRLLTGCLRAEARLQSFQGSTEEVPLPSMLKWLPESSVFFGVVRLEGSVPHWLLAGGCPWLLAAWASSRGGLQGGS